MSPTARRIGRRVVDIGLWAALVAAAVSAGSGFVRSLRPELDLFAEFAAPLFAAAVIAFVVSVLARRPRTALLLAAVAALLAWRLAPQWAPPAAPAAQGAQPVRLYFANLWARNQKMAEAARSVLTSDADVAGMVEFSDHHDAASQLLFDRYPYRLDSHRDSEAIGARTVIVSRYPLTRYEHRLQGGFSFLAVRVAHPTTPFRLIIVHMTRPWPFDTTRYLWRQIEGLGDSLRAFPAEPTVIMGDFNATAIGAPLGRLQARTGLRAAPAPVGDWPAILPGPFRLAIENAFASPDLTILNRTLGQPNGSDHRPIVFEIARAEASR